MNKYLKVGIAIGILIVIADTVLSQMRKTKKGLDPKKEDPKLSKDFNFDLIPDGKNNYRSAQILAKDLPYVIKKYNIKNIIRLNGDNTDGKHKISYPETTRAEEKAICEANGCNYYFIDAHAGYVKNKGYTKTVSQAGAILDNGNTLIHCAHGADRTGGTVGGYLKTRGIMTSNDQLWQYTTKYNGWQSMVNKNNFFGTGYDKYADNFYPIDELKKSKWVKK